MSSVIVSLIDEEIATLQQVRSVLGSIKSNTPVTEPSASPSPKVKHKMSAEGRARIAAAQKKRWAATKKVAK